MCCLNHLTTTRRNSSQRCAIQVNRLRNLLFIKFLVRLQCNLISVGIHSLGATESCYLLYITGSKAEKFILEISLFSMFFSIIFFSNSAFFLQSYLSFHKINCLQLKHLYYSQLFSVYAENVYLKRIMISLGQTNSVMEYRKITNIFIDLYTVMNTA